MATSGTRRRSPVAQPAPLDAPATGRRPTPDADARVAAARDRVLFSGNRHESVPRALFLDRRLTPLERNAWQVVRMQIRDDGAFPAYDELSPYLASMPCGGPASHETVARALTVLRLTRWLSLVQRRRDPKTGRHQGNVYVLHDEPLTPHEAMQLDSEYLGLAGRALTHAAKSVRVVGVRTLEEISADPSVSNRALPTRLEVLTQRLAEQGGALKDYPQSPVDHDSEDGSPHRLRNRGDPSSDSEPGHEAPENHGLRNPKSASTVRIEGPTEVPTTVPRARGATGLRLPDRFASLKSEQRDGALAALRQVDEGLRQAVLDEWDARCRSSAVRSPAGYLFGIVQKAIRGDFKAVAAYEAASELAEPRPPPPAPFPPPAPSTLASPEFIRACRERLRSVLGKT